MKYSRAARVKIIEHSPLALRCLLFSERVGNVYEKRAQGEWRIAFVEIEVSLLDSAMHHVPRSNQSWLSKMEFQIKPS